MSEPFIFISTYTIRPGKAEEYRKLFQALAELVQAQEPKMLYFGSHVSEDGTQVSTVQVHADADNMAFHMQVAGEHIQTAMREFIDPSAGMSTRIYGTPTEPLLEQMRQLAGSGVKVTISRPDVSFHRFTGS